MMLWLAELFLVVVAFFSRLIGREFGFAFSKEYIIFHIGRTDWTISSIGIDNDPTIVFTHSHLWPKKDTSAYCLSWSDILTAINLNYAETRAVYPHKVIRVKRPALGWPDPNEFGGSVLAVQDTLKGTRWEELFIVCRSVGIDIEVVNHGKE